MAGADPSAEEQAFHHACTHNIYSDVCDGMERNPEAVLRNPGAVSEVLNHACEAGRDDVVTRMLNVVTTLVDQETYESDSDADANFDRGAHDLVDLQPEHWGPDPVLGLMDPDMPLLQPTRALIETFSGQIPHLLSYAVSARRSGVVSVILGHECDALGVPLPALHEAFLNACRLGPLDTVQAFLLAPEPHRSVYVTGMQQEPLLTACRAGHTEIAMELIEAAMDEAGPRRSSEAGGGASEDITSERGMAAHSLIQSGLQAAVECGHEALLLALLARKEYDADDTKLEFLIQCACRSGQRAMLSILVSMWHPYFPHPGNEMLGEACLAACQTGDAGTVEAILGIQRKSEYSDDIDVYFDWGAMGQQCLDEAASQGHVEAARVLVRRAALLGGEEDEDEAGEAIVRGPWGVVLTQLAYCMFQQDSAVLEVLLTCGRDSLPSDGEYDRCRQQAAEMIARQGGRLAWEDVAPPMAHWLGHLGNRSRQVHLACFRYA